MEKQTESMMSDKAGFVTVAEPFETETVIKKSRFISRVYPVSSEEEAARITAAVKKEHYKATHVCSAWILNTVPETMKALDDGEPGGTAGRPILEILRAKGIKNALVLVIRYFGGIKLGAGGLVRAYSGGCADVLDHAELIRREPSRSVSVETEYALYQGLKNELEARNIRPISEDFSDMVRMIFEIPDGLEKKFVDLVRDFTNDSFLFETGEARLIDRPYVDEEMVL
mgnify:FL=1